MINKNYKRIYILFIVEVIIKIIGFAREILFAFFYGTSPVSDAYLVAYNIPDFITETVLAAIIIAFLPLYSQKKANNDDENTFLSNIIFIIVGISVFFSLIVEIAPGFFVKYFCSNSRTYFLAKKMVRISCLSTIFVSLTSLMELYVQYFDRYVINAFSKIIVNASLIFFVILGAYTNNIIITLGVVVGNGIRLVVLILLARKSGMKIVRPHNIKETIKEIIPLSTVVLFSGIGNQLNIIVDRILVASFESGAISALYYAYNLQNMIVSVMTLCVIRFYYPKFSKSYNVGSTYEVNIFFKEALQILSFILIPVVIGCILFNKDLVCFFYARGEFSNQSVYITASLFLAYTIGTFFVCINTLVTRLCYTIGEEKITFIVGMITVFVNLVFSILGAKILGLYGVALATSIANIVGFILNIVFVYKKIDFLLFNKKDIKILSVPIIITFSSLVMAKVISKFLFNNIFWMLCISWIALYLVLGFGYIRKIGKGDNNAEPR